MQSLKRLLGATLGAADLDTRIDCQPAGLASSLALCPTNTSSGEGVVHVPITIDLLEEGVPLGLLVDLR